MVEQEKVEQENIGSIEIGTKETERAKLEPKKVKIVGWKVKLVEKAHAEKIEFEVKHPDKEENFPLSKVSYLEGKHVITTGTWLNFDDDKKIQKGSALGKFLNKIEAKTLDESIGKEIDTELDDKNYLVFKVY